MADEFKVTHEAEKVAKEAGVKVANPWLEARKSKKPPKGLGLVIRLSRVPQKFLVHHAEFFASPMWSEKELEESEDVIEPPVLPEVPFCKK